MPRILFVSTDGAIWELLPVLNEDGITYSLAFQVVGIGGTPAQFTDHTGAVWQPVTVYDGDGRPSLAFTVVGNNGVYARVNICSIILDLIDLGIQPKKGVKLHVRLKRPQTAGNCVVDMANFEKETDEEGFVQIDVPQGLSVEVFTTAGRIPFVVDTTSKAIIRISDLIAGG